VNREPCSIHHQIYHTPYSIDRPIAVQAAVHLARTVKLFPLITRNLS